MSDAISLEELFLGYCRQVGGIVDPPAYRVYEALLPDDVAERWKISPHQRFTFTPEVENAEYIHYGHALVDTIVDEVRQKIANERFFINNVRTEKPEFYKVVEKAVEFPNAKMFPIPGVTEKILCHHYIRFNFKVSLIADEKRELILPLWMDVQGGYAVEGRDIHRIAIFDLENAFPNLPSAALLWTNEPLFSSRSLTDLLERARLSVFDALEDTLNPLQKRLQRFLELDRARLNAYYDGLQKDAERRLKNAVEDRRSAMESKLAAIVIERQLKLDDVEQKYHLRIQLELINMAMIAQPKLDLMVEIRKRGVSIKRRVTWDPLLHTVEGLVCEVCNRPGNSLLLCENGHLAHSECLAPQCVDCKRVYCQICAHDMHSCVVCDQPVCVHSVLRCKQCGRNTCKEHAGMCHADDGQPRRLTLKQPEIAEHSQELEEDSRAEPLNIVADRPAKRKKVMKQPASKNKTDSVSQRRENAGDYLEIYADPAKNEIAAYVRTKKREIAVRRWMLTHEGIAVNCWCEKLDCPEKNIIYLPAPAGMIAEQVNRLINIFAEEYFIPLNKIRYFQIRQGQPFAEKKLRIPTSWKDPEILQRAREGFEMLKKKNQDRKRP